MLRELSESEFRATFCDPMQRMEAGQSYRPVPLRSYLLSCIEAHTLPTSLEAMEIQHVYLAGDKKHSHVVFSYGVSNFFLVLVTSHESDAVLGHYFLNINNVYGLSH